MAPLIPWLAAAITSSAVMVAAQVAADDGAFQGQRNVCPESCSISGLDPKNWTRISSATELVVCEQPILLDFFLTNPLADPNTHHSIFACAGDIGAAANTTCTSSNQSTSASKATVQIAWSTETPGSASDAVAMVKHAVSDLLSKSDCTSSEHQTAFAYINGTHVGIFVGRGVSSQSAANLAQAFLQDIQTSGLRGDIQLAQVCGGNRTASRTIGIITTSSSEQAGDDNHGISRAQHAVSLWQNATCVSDPAPSSPTAESSIDIFENAIGTVDTASDVQGKSHCRTIQVVSGDGCGSLAKECGISPAKFTKFNPGKHLCANLLPGQHVCCSAGGLPDYTPKPYANGSCHDYYVKRGDTCSGIANAHDITVKQIDEFNKKTWGWMGCDDPQAYTKICLSKGDPPMPAPIQGAVCGPQVKNTKPPKDGKSLASLNPCPLNACCDIWGQCGVTPEFCTKTKSKSGAPGTAAKGTNGCISHCGTDIKKTKKGTSSFRTVGYFEEYSSGRPCLNMDTRMLQGYTGYSHIHWAFGNITAKFDVDVSGSNESFTRFMNLPDTGFKKIISFGGWAFSTDPTTYAIFRKGVTAANRHTFASNVASFVLKHDLDGVDFDWEYPGEPDIPGIPRGSKHDGANYLAFLRTLRGILPDRKSISIAAPASYWYLKHFPIAEISSVVDYIVYMTYDLHGQWDYGNKYANPGCPRGNCLRSHVNMTETMYSLAMITKAGVPSTQVVVGVTSYGRSFQMTDPSCHGPRCTFTGPKSGATPGNCTRTAGYISDAELKDIIHGFQDGPNIVDRRVDNNVTTYYDESSQSNIVIYDHDNWAAYMTQETLDKRKETYKSHNLGGSTNWAVDLENFVVPFDQFNPTSLGVDWRHVSCTIPAVAHLTNGMSNSERWQDTGAPAAWDDVIAKWKAYRGTGPYSFPDYLSSRLKGVVDFHCGSMTTDGSCETPVQCDDQDDFGPASWAIYNSMVAVHRTYKDTWSKLQHVYDKMNSQVGQMQETFAPVDNDDTWKIIADVALLLLTIVSAATFNEELAAVEGAALVALSTAKDVELAALSSGLTIIKDSLSSPDTALAEQNDAQQTIMQLVDASRTVLDKQNNFIFSGSDDGIDTLYALIGHGDFISEPRARPSGNHIEAVYLKSLFGALIPRLWTMTDYSPFVLKTDLTCDDINDVEKVEGVGIDSDYGHEMHACIDGSLYFLAGTHGDAEICPINYPCVYKDFEPMPGTDALDGSFHGLSVEGFINSSLNTYHSQGGKNDVNGELNLNEHNLREIIEHNARSPGVIRLPVCGKEEAEANWGIYAPPAGGGGEKSKNYPCD